MANANRTKEELKKEKENEKHYGIRIHNVQNQHDEPELESPSASATPAANGLNTDTASMLG